MDQQSPSTMDANDKPSTLQSGVNILDLPAHVQFSFLRRLGFHDQVLGALPTSQYWGYLLVSSLSLRRTRYSEFWFPGESKVYHNHRLLNMAAGAFFKARVKDGVITKYFLDDAGRNNLQDGDVEIYDVYEHPVPVVMDEEYMISPVGVWDVSACPYLDELALAYMPTGYEERRRLELCGEGLAQRLDGEEGGAEDYDSANDSDYEEEEEEGEEEDEGEGEGENEESEESEEKGKEENAEDEEAFINDLEETDPEELLRRTVGRQLYILVNFPGAPAMWAFELKDEDVVGKTIRETMEMAKQMVEENVRNPQQELPSHIQNRFHYDLEVRFLTWSNQYYHGCYTLLPSLQTQENGFGEHHWDCICQN
ncbi:hypothetical protein TWF730_003287 [Orbilia blumenaviensis]|uniref:Uncharacterized protein n=1 Tax=Orbilia blumenaviensis TaxID=1796055 RepID=A0AAV9U7J5_9PEZI